MSRMPEVKTQEIAKDFDIKCSHIDSDIFSRLSTQFKHLFIRFVFCIILFIA